MPSDQAGGGLFKLHLDHRFNAHKRFVMTFKRVLAQFILWLTSLTGLSLAAQEQSWVDMAVHNFGAPINTMWAEGELSFAADGTMVYCSARQDMAVAPGDPKDLYIATFDSETGSWNQPVNICLLYTSPSPRDLSTSRMPSSA